MKLTNKPKNEKKKYVIYTRCSTDEQAMGDFTTLDVQAHHCKSMLEALGYELADFGNKGRVNDDGYSGKDLKRPGIQSILESIDRKREFDGIIFLKLDRLTRNPRDLYMLIDLLRENDVDFISVRENLDSSTAIGRVVIGILGLLSAFERELTGERVKASALARVKEGLRVGGKTPIGYKLVNNGDPLPNGKQPKKVVIDEDIAPHIQAAFEMAADNRSLTEIGQELLKRNILTTDGYVWRRQGISTIIKNPFYKGYLKYDGETYRSKHEPLVSEALWEKANNILIARLPGHSFAKANPEYTFLMSGMIRCGACDSHMVNTHSIGRGKKKWFYYECSRSRQGLGCTHKRISAPEFDEAIINYFKRASENQEIITQAIGNTIREATVKSETIEKTLQGKQHELEGLRHDAEKMLDIILSDTITQGPTYKTKLANIETQISILEDEIIKLQAQKRVAEMNASSGEFLHTNLKVAMKCLSIAPPEAQKSLLQALIKNVVVYDDKIAINMYLEPNLGDLPTLPKSTKNKKNLTTELCDDKVSKASAGIGSQRRLIWGRLQDDFITSKYDDFLPTAFLSLIQAA